MDGQGRRPWRRKGHFGRRWPEPESEFPAIPDPGNARFSVKQIAYLHAYCGKEPRGIVARYPKTLSLAEVHSALADYYRSKDAIDAEIAAEIRLNARDSLAEARISPPSMRDAPLAKAAMTDNSPAGARTGRQKV
jgi:hypothetical protein